LERLNCAPAEAVMVGDDWEQDIAPAGRLGLHTFWVAPPDMAPLAGRGTLTDFQAWLEAN